MTSNYTQQTWYERAEELVIKVEDAREIGIQIWEIRTTYERMLWEVESINKSAVDENERKKAGDLLERLKKAEGDLVLENV